LLESRGIPSVRGNHDRWLRDRPVERLAGSDRFAHDQLGEAWIGKLYDLLTTIDVNAEVYAVHGTPTDDNTYLLRASDPVGERLGRVAAEHGMLLMLCDRCALERCLAEGEIGAALPTGTVAGVRVGCFPDLYAALAGDPPDHVITL